MRCASALAAFNLMALCSAASAAGQFQSNQKWTRAIAVCDSERLGPISTAFAAATRASAATSNVEVSLLIALDAIVSARPAHASAYFGSAAIAFWKCWTARLLEVAVR